MNYIISVIVPVYNVCNYIEKCITSIINQSYSEIQIILVDDGSTDCSGDICDAFAKEDNRIQVIHKKNGGLVSARKSGIELASGEYVTFVDGDDWVDIDWYVNQVHVIEREKPDIIAFGCVEEYESYSKPIRNKLDNGYYVGRVLDDVKSKCIVDDVFFEWNILPHLCDKIIRRSILKTNISNVDNCITFGEDATTTYPCMWSAKSLLVVNDCPYHYRQRSGSMSKIYEDLLENQLRCIQTSLLIGSKCLYNNQVNLYMHFILLLRRYAMYDKYNMTLFPFEQVKETNSIILYGAGGFGRSLYKYINEYGKINIVSWVDKEYRKYQNDGLSVFSIEQIRDKEFDYIVIAILNENMAGFISKEFQSQGYERDKILFISHELIEKYHIMRIIN